MKNLRFGRVRSFARLVVLRRCGAGGDRLGGSVRAITHEVGHERSNFKRHLFAFRHRANRLALNQRKAVVPWVNLYAAADGKRGDPLRIRLGIDRHRRFQVGDIRNAVPEVAADEVWNFLLAAVERLQEESGVSELIFVRRIIEDLNGLGIRLGFFFGSPGKTEVTEGVLVVDQQLVEEGVLGIEAVAENDVGEFVGEDGRQAGFIGQNVNQAAAENDGVADSEGFQRGSHQDAAAHLGIDVDIIGDLEVVDDGFEDLVDFALGGHQTDAFEAVNNVVFRLAVPGALGLNRGKVVGGLGVVLHGSLDENLAELLFLGVAVQVVAPEAGLGLEIELLGNGVVQILFLRVDEGRQPQAGLHVGAPAIEVEIPACVAVAGVGAVEANDVEVLIFHPDAAEEAAAVVLFERGHVENEAANFAQEFAANVVELIVRTVEAVGVEEDHLQEAVGEELHGEAEEISDGHEDLFALAGGFVQGHEVDAFLEVGAAEEVFVAGGNLAQILIGFEVLNVGFH